MLHPCMVWGMCCPCRAVTSARLVAAPVLSPVEHRSNALVPLGPGSLHLHEHHNYYEALCS